MVYMITGIIGSVFGLCLSGMFQICSLPSIMVLFPKSRFGSFCSMQALLRSTCYMLMSIVCGVFFDLLKAYYTSTTGNANFAFRYMAPWSMPWYLLAALFGYLLYREWGRHGGLRDYAPPASWEPSEHEQMEVLPVKRVSPKALLVALKVIDACYVFFTILLPLYAFWHCRWRANGESGLLHQYLIAPTILALVADAIWLVVRMRLARQARRILRGEEEHRGLLHPGMALVMLFTYVAGHLTMFCGNTYARGTLGYVTNILFACSMILMAIVFALLARMEYGIPQPQEEPRPTAG